MEEIRLVQARYVTKAGDKEFEKRRTYAFVTSMEENPFERGEKARSKRKRNNILPSQKRIAKEGLI